jgi:hypothetical protein
MQFSLTVFDTAQYLFSFCDEIRLSHDRLDSRVILGYFLRSSISCFSLFTECSLRRHPGRVLTHAGLVAHINVLAGNDFLFSPEEEHPTLPSRANMSKNQSNIITGSGEMSSEQSGVVFFKKRNHNG